MVCRIDELRNKQVVCLRSGEVLGYIADIEIDSQNGKINSLVIFGKPRLFGFLGTKEDIVIPWEEIEIIGSETVLVKNGTQLCNLK